MKGIITAFIVLIISFIIGIVDHTIFDSSYHNIVMLVSAFLSFIPYAVSKKKNNAVSNEIKILFLMSLISTIIIFSGNMFSIFKPFTFVTIICGSYFGVPAGYICGVVSVIVSSILMGTGSWTTIAVLAMGIIGIFSGLFKKSIHASNIFMIIFALLSSFIYSCADTMQFIWTEGRFALELYPQMIIDSAKWFVIYAIVDVVALFVFKRFVGKRLLRIKKRFGIFQ